MTDGFISVRTLESTSHSSAIVSDSYFVRLPQDDVNDLLSMSSFATLCRFQSRSKHAASAVRLEVRSRVLRALAQNIKDPEAFLDQLRECNAVLSGQFVLSVIDPLETETYSTIDVFTSDDGFLRFVEYLEDTNNGRLHSFERVVPGLSDDGFHYAFEVHCASVNIRVVRAKTCFPAMSIPFYYSTHLMNYIAHDRVSVAYPSSTFIRRGILRDAQFRTDADFTVAPASELFPHRTCTNPHACGSHIRSFSDSSTATVIIGEDDSSSGCVKWRLGGEKCSITCQSDTLQTWYI